MGLDMEKPRSQRLPHLASGECGGQYSSLWLLKPQVVGHGVQVYEGSWAPFGSTLGSDCRPTTTTNRWMCSWEMAWK